MNFESGRSLVKQKNCLLSAKEKHTNQPIQNTHQHTFSKIYKNSKTLKWYIRLKTNH
jgi:hypothetical protein